MKTIDELDDDIRRDDEQPPSASQRQASAPAAQSTPEDGGMDDARSTSIEAMEAAADGKVGASNAAAQQAANAQAGATEVPPAPGGTPQQGGVPAENGAGKPPPTVSDAVRMKQLELENALRIKGIDTALAMWRENVNRENALRDREMAFEEWKQKTAIAERDRVARLAATSFKRSYHGTFSGGFLSSSWAGPKVNPYKTLLDKLEGQIGGNPYSAALENRKAPSMPDWLKPLLPNGVADQRKPMNPGVQSGVQGQQDGRGAVSVSAYHEAFDDGYTRAGRTARMTSEGRESAFNFDESRFDLGRLRKDRELANKKDPTRQKKIQDVLEAL